MKDAKIQFFCFFFLLFLEGGKERERGEREGVD